MFLIFNEGTKRGMLTCTDTKILFHEDNLVTNFAPKITNLSQSYPFFKSLNIVKDQVVRNYFQ